MPHDAFFLPTNDPDVFVATRSTQSLWTPGQQHAGPPSALLTRQFERTPSSIPGESQLTRLTMEILGPVPIGEVSVRSTLARAGRTVELLEAELTAGGRVALRSRAWRMRTAKISLPDGADPNPPAPPIPTEVATFREAAWEDGYLGAVQWRFVHGHFQDHGPAAVWSRLRVPLVAGEQPTATQRLMAAADSGNGLSGLLPFDDWWFINTDLTVHLHRLPVGDWVYLDARSTLDRSGVGLAETEIYDETGRVGRGAQTLMVGPR